MRAEAPELAERIRLHLPSEKDPRYGQAIAAAICRLCERSTRGKGPERIVILNAAKNPVRAVKRSDNLQRVLRCVQNDNPLYSEWERNENA